MTTFNAKSPTGRHTLQHICRRTKPRHKANLQKSCNLPPHCKHSYCWQINFSLSSPPMKFLFFIMGFLLLYLSCLPCGDSRECNVNAQVKISATDNHQEHKHTSESCTPFCTCSCCAASAFFSTFSKAQATKVIFQSEKYPLYNVTFNTETHYSIFQPPKIS